MELKEKAVHLVITSIRDAIALMDGKIEGAGLTTKSLDHILASLNAGDTAEQIAEQISKETDVAKELLAKLDGPIYEPTSEELHDRTFLAEHPGFDPDRPQNPERAVMAAYQAIFASLAPAHKYIGTAFGEMRKRSWGLFEVQSYITPESMWLVAVTCPGQIHDDTEASKAFDTREEAQAYIESGFSIMRRTGNVSERAVKFAEAANIQVERAGAKVN